MWGCHFFQTSEDLTLKMNGYFLTSHWDKEREKHHPGHMEQFKTTKYQQLAGGWLLSTQTGMGSTLRTTCIWVIGICLFFHLPWDLEETEVQGSPQIHRDFGVNLCHRKHCL